VQDAAVGEPGECEGGRGVGVVGVVHEQPVAACLRDLDDLDAATGSDTWTVL
jgi:hypothetical protein